MFFCVGINMGTSITIKVSSKLAFSLSASPINVFIPLAGVFAMENFPNTVQILKREH